MRRQVFWYGSLCLLALVAVLGYKAIHKVRQVNAQPGPQQGPEQPEEYAVYDALLGSGVVRGASRAKLMVILDKTRVPEELATAESVRRVAEWGHKRLEDEIVRDFVNKNKTQHLLKPRFRITAKCVLVSEKELEEMFRGGWWPDFYAKYPDSPGTIELSGVGFNCRADEALLYVGNQLGGDSGEGDLLLLGKVRGRWRVKWKTVGWVS